MELLPWYDANKRDLPWRRSTELYPVWISEIMLQQTRVATAIAYFERWMQRFPIVQDLAAASQDEVMAAWSGLGYYTRARNLHKAARCIAKDGWPANLQSLPGVGPYTAAAIGSICRNEPVAVVDGNVERVVSRLFAFREDVRKEKKQVQALADSLLDAARPGDWNQAMMELGATICKPAPLCHECPVRAHCKAHADGIQDQLPVKPSKRPPKEVEVQFALVETELGVLMRQREEGELLAGTWSLPDLAHVEAQTGYQVRPIGNPTEIRHQFTHRTWNMQVVPCRLDDASHAHFPSRWIPRDQLHTFGISTAMQKALNL